MRYFNVVYDYDYNEDLEQIEFLGKVDILGLPDWLVSEVEKTLQNFFNWVEKNQIFYSKENNGKVICNVDGSDFVNWLNQKVLIGQKALLVKKNVEVCLEYPCLEF